MEAIQSIVYIFAYCKCFPRTKKSFTLILYKSCMFFIRSSLSFFELTYMLFQENCVNNGVTNGLK